MDCKEVLIFLWEYLDEELGPEEAVAVAGHLGHCGTCYPAYCCDRALLDLVARQRTACSAPAALVMAIRAQLKLSSGTADLD
jgi:mycothiol system anti-sigma-R factor